MLASATNITRSSRSGFKPILPDTQNVALTIGKFDGVHLGHQQLIKKMLAKPADRYVVVKLWPHPQQILSGIKQYDLMSIRQLAYTLASYGVTDLYLVPFTKYLASMSAEKFLDDCFLRVLNAKRLVVGSDAAVGKNRAGDLAMISNYLPGRGCEVEIVPFYTDSNQEVVSTRRVKQELLKGELDLLYLSLGRHYSIIARVTKGQQLGRRINFPTLNLAIKPNLLLPPNGVYATVANINGAYYPSVTNLGYRPTFTNKTITVESHLLGVDFNFDYLTNLIEPNYYASTVELKFIQFIRNEIKFASVTDLKQQIYDDCQVASSILQSISIK